MDSEGPAAEPMFKIWDVAIQIEEQRSSSFPELSCFHFLSCFQMFGCDSADLPCNFWSRRKCYTDLLHWRRWILLWRLQAGNPRWPLRMTGPFRGKVTARSPCSLGFEHLPPASRFEMRFVSNSARRGCIVYFGGYLQIGLSPNHPPFWGTAIDGNPHLKNYEELVDSSMVSVA